MSIRRVLSILAGLCAMGGAAAGQTCTPSWIPTFQGSGVQGAVYSALTFDFDGPGPQPPSLVIAGSFTKAGGVAVPYVARWDGTQWQPVGNPATGPDNRVECMAVYDDDGNGPDAPTLYIGGAFAHIGGVSCGPVARWTGATWDPVGPTPPQAGLASTMVVFDDDGPGPHRPQLIVGGRFNIPGFPSTLNIAAWDGAAWATLGASGGIANNDSVVALTVMDDDGPGPLPPALYAGGNFSHVGAQTIVGVARWDGSSWTSPAPITTSLVTALQSFDDDGPGPDLPTLFMALDRAIYKLDAGSWVLTTPFNYGGTLALTVLDDDGPGPDADALYAVGGFLASGAGSGRGIAKWNGASWVNVGAGVQTNDYVRTITVADTDGDGPLPPGLLIGGPFSVTGNFDAFGVARWTGQQWVPLGNGIGGPVDALASYDPDGAGPATPLLLVGGQFRSAGQVVANGIVAWNGSSFQPLGSGVTQSGRSPAVNAIAVMDPDGPGPLPPTTYIGGDFSSAGGVPAGYIAQWNGSTWSPVGAGFDFVVLSLAVYDNGSGPSLYAGGRFRFSGLSAVDYMARWTGSTWVAVPQVTAQIPALAAFDEDGNGPGLPALFASGAPQIIGRWNGSAWSSVGVSPPPGVLVLSTQPSPGGGPPLLYAGGNFVSAGGVVANRIATWDGSAWGPVGFGLQNGVNGAVDSVMSFDHDGPGPASSLLYVGGNFQTAGNQPASAIASFDGADWAALGSGLSDPSQPEAMAMAVYDPDGSGPQPAALFVGGRFQAAGGVPAANLARWGCTPPLPCYANCDGSTAPPILNVNDFQCFLNKYAAGDPYANCDGSATPPILNVNDFQCFLNRYAAGCP